MIVTFFGKRLTHPSGMVPIFNYIFKSFFTTYYRDVYFEL